MKEKKYIILGLTPQGLALLRELGKAGADVTAFCTSKRNVGFHSRYGKKFCYQNMLDLKCMISNIVSKSPEKPICYISSGEILASVLRQYKELYDICNVYSGPYSVLNMLSHKDQMYRYAAGKGFKIAKYATLDIIDIEQFSFPIFLKRNYEIPLFFKAVKIGSREEYLSYKKCIPKNNLKDVIAQEYIDISDSRLINISCQGFWCRGRCMGLYVANQQRKLSKGITSYLEEITDENMLQRIRRLTEDFMISLKYNGFAEFEFMYDKESDIYWFIEINTRTCGEQSALHYKFSNLTNVLLNPEKYQPLQIAMQSLCWMNIQRDIRARLEHRDWKHLYDIFRAKYDIFDWKDPMPFFRQLI